MAFEDCCQHGAKVGGDGEIAPLVELRRSETGPITINPAAIDGAAQYPDDVAVAVIGAPVAVFPKGAAEFRQDDDDGVLPGLTRPAGEGGETLAERAQTIGQLPVVIALVDVGVPTAEPECCNADAGVTADQQREPSRLAGEAGRGIGARRAFRVAPGAREPDAAMDRASARLCSRRGFARPDAIAFRRAALS